MKIRIYYEDTDAAGIVYHANFIKYCERARSEIFFSQGFYLQNEQSNEHFVVRSINSNFLKVAFLGDMLEVTTDIVERKNSSVILRQEILRGDELICTFDVVLVYVKEYKAVRVPDTVFQILSNTKKA